MVQPKKKETIRDAMARHAKEFNEQNPVIKYGWVVEEITPAYNTGGYYDQDIPEERVVVSPMFDCDGLAYEWIDAHEPDEGKQLKISKFALREYRPKPYRKWERA